MHGVLCAFYMAAIVAVNREAVKKNVERQANLTEVFIFWNL